MQTRDLYVPGDGVGMWQGAIRNPEDPVHAALIKAIDEGEPITIELLYSDLTGKQRAITRFGLQALGEDAERPDRRFTAMSRIWFLDFGGPRPDTEAISQRVSTILAETGIEPS